MRIQVRLFVFFLLTGFSLQLAAQSPSEKMSLDPQLRYGKLSNGLTYYIRKNAKPEQRAEMRLVVNAGSVQEKDNQQGIAHFVEHMAFNGTTNFPKNELLNYLQKAGVRFGADLNATTSFDFTMYMLPIPTDNPELLSKGYQVLRDWAGGILFDKEEIEKERGVIIEEKRMRQNANQRMLEQFLPPLTNNSKYGQRLPIGKEETIKTAPREVFLDYYRAWYRPNNMAVIVVGDVDPAQAEATIKRLFGDLKNPADAPKREAVTPIQWHGTNKALVIADKEMVNSQVSIYFDLKRKENEDTWQAFSEMIKKEIISQLFSERLQESFVNPKSPVSGGRIAPQDDFLHGYSVSNISAVVKTNVDSAIHYMVAQVMQGQQFGFTEDELQRAKKNYFSRYDVAILEKDKTESAAYTAEIVEHFLNQAPAPGIDKEYQFVKQVLDGFTLAEVNQRVKAIDLNKPVFVQCNTTEALKGNTSEASLLAAFSRAKQQTVIARVETMNSGKLMQQEPSRGKVVSKQRDDVLQTDQLTLSNGMVVIYKKTDFKNDEIVMRGTRWGGLSALTDQEVKLANYLPFVGGLGLGDNKAVEVNKILSGATVGFAMNLSPAQVILNGRSSVKDLEKYFQVMHLRLTNVNWDQQEFDGVKTSFASQIGMLAKNPGIKFNDTLNRHKYGYSRRVNGLPDTKEMDRMQMQDLKVLNAKITGDLAGTVLVFSGNIPEQQFIDLLERYVASIPTLPNKAEAKKENLVRPITGNNHFSFRYGKENKSEINFSYYGVEPTVSSKDIMAFGLLGDILQIKATEKLREEMGSTYSPKVGAALQRPPVSEFNLTLTVSSLPENTGKIITAFRGLVKSVLGGELSEEDLQKAKAQRIRVFETAAKTNDYWVLNLESQYSFGYDKQIIIQYTNMLQQLTKEDILATAKRVLQKANTLEATMNPEQ
ncbi:MAG: insulinase family protein [Chitinophagaceae bacterium]